MTFDQLLDAARDLVNNTLYQEYKRGYENGLRDAAAAQSQSNTVVSGGGGGGNQYIPPHVYVSIGEGACGRCGLDRQAHQYPTFVRG